MPFKIVRNDITKMQVDAIVNTANEAPVYSLGTDTAVYKAAGEEALLEARGEIGFMEEGEVAITPGFQLPAKYIIHAVSPFYEDGRSGEEELLRSCYRKSLELAYHNDCKSIAFPLISTGSFGYPKDEGMRVAVDEINAFLLKHEMMIYLVVFDEESTRLGRNLYPDLESYIDRNYVRDKSEEEYDDRYFGSDKDTVSDYRNHAERSQKLLNRPVCASEAVFTSKLLSVDKDVSGGLLDANEGACDGFIEESGTDYDNFVEAGETDYDDFIEESEAALQERMKHMSDTFQQYLLYLIESKGLTNAQVYKRAIIQKQLFSKIKLNPNYHPDKATAMRLCIGAKLNMDETKDLLARAGYALSPCDKRDIIFSYFIEHNVHDMIEIDIVLEEYGLPCFIE